MFLVVLFFQCIVSYTKFSLNLILAFFASYYWGINECQLAACALVAMKHTAGPVIYIRLQLLIVTSPRLLVLYHVLFKGFSIEWRELMFFFSCFFYIKLYKGRISC